MKLKSILYASALCALAILPAYSAAQNAPAQRTYEGMVTKEVYITTRYGDEMNIDLCFPAEAGSTEPAPGRFPVIVELSYLTSAGHRDCVEMWREFVRHGYVAGFVNVPGSGATSSGPWVYGEKTWALRNYDAIEWLGTQSWSNGNVGTIGGSGNGVSQVNTAPYRPPHLKAMIPIYTSGDGYKMLYPGGMRSLATTLLVCGIPGTLTYVRQGVFLPPESLDDILRMIDIQLNKVAELQLPYCPPLYGFWQHPLRDEFWDQNGVAALQNVDIPTWIWSSWDDLFVNGSVDDYLTLSSPNKMIAMGYASHASIGVGGVISGVQGELRGLVLGFDHTKEALRWFDRWLKGIDNGIDADLKSRRFRYMRYQDWQSRQAKNYPIPGTAYTRYYLGGQSSLLSTLLTGVDGSLSKTAPKVAGSSGYTYIPATNGLAAGPFSGFLRLHNQTDPTTRDFLAYNDLLGRLDQRLDPLGRVVYLSEPLQQDMEITGPITMRLHAETTASDTDWVVKLIDVVPNNLASLSVSEPQPGYWHLVQPGHLKGGFRSFKGDYRQSTPIPTNQIVGYDVQIWPTSWLFKKGHRIGVSIASSDFPYVFPNLNPAVIKVHHSPQHPSYIELPVVTNSQPDSSATTQ
jgi:uncharacterized protein